MTSFHIHVLIHGIHGQEPKPGGTNGYELLRVQACQGDAHVSQLGAVPREDL